MFLAIIMLSPAVSVLHTAECELRLDSFSSSPDNLKGQHKTFPYVNFLHARKSYLDCCGPEASERSSSLICAVGSKKADF